MWWGISERRRRLSASAAVVVAMLAPASARAANGAIPRTPPVFQQVECLRIVDRSATSSFTVEFSIPVQDGELTADELPDSRRFQFFALCSDSHLVVDPIPNWIVRSDAERALEAGIIAALPEPEDVLATHPVWSGCALPINAADDRIPITCEATEGGVGWDLSAVPPGNYVIRGYNFEPEANLWRARRGVVQITDGATLPVVSLMSPAVRDSQAYEESGPVVEGCMDGPPGTAVALQWARLRDLEVDEPSDWTTFAQLDAADGSFSVRFEPPPSAVAQSIVFRGRAEDPSGRSWVGYAVGSATIFPGDGEPDGPTAPAGLDHCGFFPDESMGSSGGAMPSSTGSSGSDSTGATSASGPEDGSVTPDADTESTGGCGCRVSRRGGDEPRWPRWLLWPLLGLCLRPRRRHAPRA